MNSNLHDAKMRSHELLLFRRIKKLYLLIEFSKHHVTLEYSIKTENFSILETEIYLKFEYDINYEYSRPRLRKCYQKQLPEWNPTEASQERYSLIRGSQSLQWQLQLEIQTLKELDQKKYKISLQSTSIGLKIIVIIHSQFCYCFMSCFSLLHLAKLLRFLNSR